MPKDPKRWNEVIIDSPFAKLTKRDVFDYYNKPDIKQKILDATGKRETILRQNFDADKSVLRRKDHKGNFIYLSNNKKFDFWNNMRMTEVNPTFGKTTNALVADIDPGKNVSWRKTKAIVEAIAKTMASAKHDKPKPESTVDIQFSGDDGFYVKSLLNKKTDINEARKKVKDLLKGFDARPDITFGKATDDQIRIDLSPMKNRGSIKAPYSLSARTGLVAAPVKLEDMPKMQRSDFKIDKIASIRKRAISLESLRKATRALAPKRIRRDFVQNMHSGSIGTTSKALPATEPLTTGWTYPGYATASITKKPAAHFSIPTKKSIPRIFSKGQSIRQNRDTLETLKKIPTGTPEQEAAKKALGVPHRDLLSIWKGATPAEKEAINRTMLLHEGAEATAMTKFPGFSPGSSGHMGPRPLMTESNIIATLPPEVRQTVKRYFETIRSMGTDPRYLQHIKSVYPKFEYGVTKVPKRVRRHIEEKSFGKAGSAKKEFAPGIPIARTIDPIPSIKDKAWTLAVQKHDAQKAGTHFDLRLVDPKTDKAHSFAVPKARLPRARDRMLLAIQQPTHTADYALNFTGTIPAGTYGAGRVTTPIKEKIDVIKANADKIQFQREDGKQYILFRTEGNNWGFRQKKT